MYKSRRTLSAALVAVVLTSAQLPLHAADAPQLWRSQGMSPGRCLVANDAGINQTAPCSTTDARQRFEPGTAVVPVPAPPPTSASAPAPAPAPAPEPPKTTTPAEVPGADVPLSHKVAKVEAGYGSIARPPYRVVNNTWGVKLIQAGGWSQSIGTLGLGADGSLDFRLAWDYSAVTKLAPNAEIISYPEVAYGRSASFDKEAGAKLPLKVGGIESLVTQYKALEVGSTRGQAHVVYDLWTSNNPAALAKGNRLAEIMLSEMPIAGYGVPNSPAAATVGRAGQQASGRNPRGYQGRFDVGGDAFDVYFYPANSPYTGLAWKFIVFQPVQVGGAGGRARQWVPLLRFMQARGWISGDDWLNAVEFGVEPAHAGSKGDLTVRGFKVEVQ